MAKETSAFSRRDFLKLAGKTAVASGLWISGCGISSAPQTGGAASGDMRRATSAIDIHHHYFAPELINEIKQHGRALGIEYFPPKDSRENPMSIQFTKGHRLNLNLRLAEVDKRLEIMIQGNIAVATVEVQTSAVGYELDGVAASPGPNFTTKRFKIWSSDTPIVSPESPPSRCRIRPAQPGCWSMRSET
jgi:hypothetical protein